MGRFPLRVPRTRSAQLAGETLLFLLLLLLQGRAGPAVALFAVMWLDFDRFKPSTAASSTA